MTLSLITPSYNSAKTIARTIDSVIAQNYSDLEYIILDGASTDDTLKIIASYQDKINIRLVSERDNGIYDAMNKGIKIATGDIIGILNSDDLFNSGEVIKTVADAFADAEIDAVYGDIKYFADDINKITRYWRAGEYKENKLNNGWIIPHPALFLRRSVYEKAGLFNTDFKIAGDYEFMLRILKIHQIKVKYIPEVFAKMYDGGKSAESIDQRKRGWQELKNAWLVNNMAVPKLFIFRRLLFKFSQYIIK
jgi:glycosyltransferase involved in cell wall biosynthesis